MHVCMFACVYLHAGKLAPGTSRALFTTLRLHTHIYISWHVLYESCHSCGCDTTWHTQTEHSSSPSVCTYIFIWHIYLIHVTHVGGSCCTYEKRHVTHVHIYMRDMSYMSHVTHVDVIRHVTHRQNTRQLPPSAHTYLCESCRSCGWVMLYIWKKICHAQAEHSSAPFVCTYIFTWHIYMSHVTHVDESCWTYEIRHFTHKQSTRGLPPCVHTYSYVWHVSCHMCDKTHLYVWHDSFICVTWLVSSLRLHIYIHMRDMFYFTCATWLDHMCDITHSVLRDSFICVTWLVHMCNVTHQLPPSTHTYSYEWHDSR